MKSLEEARQKLIEEGTAQVLCVWFHQRSDVDGCMLS